MIQTIQPIQSPTPNPNPISYKREYLHVYSYVNYDVLNVPSDVTEAKVLNGRLYFTVKLLKDLYRSYDNNPPHNPTFEKHLGYLGFTRNFPGDSEGNSPSIISISNHYHAAKMGFLKLFRITLFAETARTVNNIWGNQRQHTIACSGNLTDQECISNIASLNYYGPMQGYDGLYEILAGSIKRIHVRK